MFFLPRYCVKKLGGGYRGGFKHLLFSPVFGEDSHWTNIFQMGLKPPTSIVLRKCLSPVTWVGKLWHLFSDDS